MCLLEVLSLTPSLSGGWGISPAQFAAHLDSLRAHTGRALLTPHSLALFGGSLTESSIPLASVMCAVKEEWPVRLTLLLEYTPLPSSFRSHLRRTPGDVKGRVEVFRQPCLPENRNGVIARSSGRQAGNVLTARAAATAQDTTGM